MQARLFGGQFRQLVGIAAGALLVVSLMTAYVAAQTPQAPPPAPAGSTHEQRVAQRRNEREINLDERSQQRLINTCVSAQCKFCANLL